MRKAPKGFTLIEIVFVTAIIGIVILATAPMSQPYLQREAMLSMQRNIRTALFLAGVNARAGKADTAWGVNIDGGFITVFSGNSYAARNNIYDHTTIYSEETVVTGTREYVFEKMTGLNSSGTTTATSSSGQSFILTVNDHGTAEDL